MQILTKVNLLCRTHQSYDEWCPTCQFLKLTEDEWLRQRTLRTKMLQELKKHLASKDLVIGDLQ